MRLGLGAQPLGRGAAARDAVLGSGVLSGWERSNGGAVRRRAAPLFYGRNGLRQCERRVAKREVDLRAKSSNRCFRRQCKACLHNILQQLTKRRHMGCTRGASRFLALQLGAQDSDTTVLRSAGTSVEGARQATNTGRVNTDTTCA